jgi:hypothetical protein
MPADGFHRHPQDFVEFGQGEVSALAKAARIISGISLGSGAGFIGIIAPPPTRLE